MTHTSDDQILQPSSAIPTGTVDISDEDIPPTTNNSPLSPDEIGERQVSGNNPTPGSDDNMMDNEHDVGLYTDSDDDDAPELNIADQIEKAEKYHRDQ